MSDIKYIDEHLACFNYENNSRNIVQLFDLEEDTSTEKIEFKSLQQHKMFYLIKGDCTLTIQNNKQEIGERNFFIMPIGSHFQISTRGTTKLCLMKLKDIENLCNNYSLDMLLEDCNSIRDNDLTSVHPIKARELFGSFFELFWKVYNDGGRCRCFLEDKIKELQFLFRLYYSKTELLKFYKPILSQDISFSSIILRNHAKVKTVAELAELVNYSMSGFHKKFKNVFGVPAHNWMKREKMKLIYHDITSSDNTFKEITYKYGFSSPSHFNDYCKVNFGYTPGKLRKNKVKQSIGDLLEQDI